MTNFAEAPPLLTDADVLVRVEQLVGPAAADRRLWIMWVDGDGQQAPVIVPVDDMPRHPDRSQLDGLAEVLAGLRDELATESGPCSVVFTLERLGLDGVLPGSPPQVLPQRLCSATDHGRTWLALPGTSPQSPDTAAGG